MKTNETTSIPQGYKATPLGIIPQEWEVRRLGDLCCNQGDYGINAPAVAYSKNLPTYLRITDISDDGKFIIDNKASVNSPNSESYHLKEGDIVFARTGATVGKTYLYDSADGDLVFAGFLIRFSPNKQKIIPYYLKTYTNTVAYWRWVKITSQRSGQPGINAAEYSSLQLPVPPLAEQKKIAEVLGVWDKAIEKQSQLIEQLTLRKRGLMQQLLTAKRRLPGFSEPWKKVRLEEICLIKRGNPLSSTQIRDGIYPVIAGGKTSPYFHDEYTDENVITISASGAYAGFVSLHEDKIWASDCSVISSRDGLSVLKYIYYLLALKQIYIYSLQVGGAQPHVLPIDIAKMKIYVPAKAEQTAIAQVLTAADREIELAQQKLELLRQQKRGLMQQLLTGQIRVKVN